MSIQAKLPVVAFNKEAINHSTDAWLSTSNSVRRALENYGCFVIKTDKIPSGLRDTMFGLSKDLFRLPLETKIKNTSDLLCFGYGGNFSSMPLWEYFSIENASTLEATQNFTDLLFPSGNNAFCEATFEYMKLLSEINHCVLRMVFDSYGVEAKQCHQFIESSFYLARFMKYGVPSEDKSAIAIDHPHSDKSFLSILDENNVKGLEMKMKNGEWVYHEPSPSTLVVIAGEPFTAWSNGRIYAPVHQVAMRKPEKEAIKFTLGIFSFIKETIEVPEKLISYDNDKCLRFGPFNHLEFLKYVIAEEMKGTKCSIKSYCGVNAETRQGGS